MLAVDEVAEAFSPGTHASTFGGNFLVTAAAIAAIKATLEEGVLDNCRKVGEYLFKKLLELKKEYPFIKEVRGRGLMIGVEFDRPAIDIVNKCLEKGLIINSTGETVLRFIPALIVTEKRLTR